MNKRRRKQGPDDFRSRFGFNTTPFSRELLVDRRHQLTYVEELLEDLYQTLLLRESAALIAPAGCGKTVVARALKARLPEARFRVHYVKVTDLSKRDMCREIALAADCRPAGNFPTLVRRLQERFQRAVESDGARPVLILDDAHEMRPETLGLLKVLTNFDMDSRLVLSVVLVGQPSLLKTLRREDLEDVARRLALYVQLRLLSREEVRSYVEHRCALVGAVQPPFDDSGFEALYEFSRGNMRAIDRLGLTSLQIASKEGHDVVTAADVAKARKNLWP